MQWSAGGTHLTQTLKMCEKLSGLSDIQLILPNTILFGIISIIYYLRI